MTSGMARQTGMIDDRTGHKLTGDRTGQRLNSDRTVHIRTGLRMPVTGPVNDQCPATGLVI
ncbi:hypothetical protein DPMN_159983 [Dreissena polymorpha]|uniref:Uncharacterized protein n=1 Tax=Dreissena polymorpha TaxID=45954 RepID=A0A9D4EQC0_DREPO|nr:hypothetical protein DPMN_159983 [Dreissena polymorpha]